MARTKIYSKNPNFNGLRGDVVFRDGVGETDNAKALQWFEGREGYSVGKPFAVEKEAAPQDNELENLTLAELRQRAKAVGVEGYQTMPKADLIQRLSQ